MQKQGRIMYSGRDRDHAVDFKLIGGMQRDPEPGDISFHGELFRRLPKEVSQPGVTRYVAFDSSGHDGSRCRFLGLEVDEIDRIPAGMVAWELLADTWRITDDRQGVARQEQIGWLWCSDQENPVGEFTVRDESGDTFQLTGNSYVDFQKEGCADGIHLVESDPVWPVKFREMADWLRQQFCPGIILRVEHYGSTAIPGIPAKPVIDILVEVPSFPQAKETILPILNSEEWEYWWYSDHMIFIKRNGLMGERTHHIHIAPEGHRLWEGLLFRDHLRSHPEKAGKYAELKADLARRHGKNREVYTQAKTDFIQAIVSECKRSRK